MEYAGYGFHYLLRLEKGEEITAALLDFCKQNNVAAGFVSGIGATNLVTVGLFDTKDKAYHSTTFTGDMEITSLSGNISRQNGEPYLHLHITVADGSHHVIGGHLNRCVISITAEINLVCVPIPTNRLPEEEFGINLLHFPEGTVSP